MPRLTQDQWESVRAEREAGATFLDLASRFGVSHTAIIKRSKAEGWGDGQDVAEAIRRKVTEKVSGVVSTENPKKKAEAIDSAAERGAKIIARHQEDWEAHHEKFTVKVVADNFDMGKSAKICAEMLAIRQKAERSAYGLDDREENNAPVITVVTGVPD